jgi:transmembrane sensor
LSNYIPNMSDDLLVKYLLNETSTEEKEAVEQWLKESEANGAYFGQIKSIWEESKKLALTSEVDEEGAWQRFKTKIPTPKEAAPIKRISRFGWMRIAALFVTIIGAALIIYTMNREAAVETLTASSGNAVLKDTLSDGSVVTLNKNSSLTYPERFKETTRTVALKGEAFFSVTPDKEKPFTIEVNDVVVKVVGTSFNIRSENEMTEVIVETGIVQVTHKGKSVELRPGEKLLVPAKDTALVVQKETDQLYNYYRSREFVCENTPLWKLVDVLNKAYNANIIIERQELKGLPLNATFSNESLDRILEIIDLTFNTYNIQIEKKEDRIILR